MVIYGRGDVGVINEQFAPLKTCNHIFFRIAKQHTVSHTEVSKKFDFSQGIRLKKEADEGSEPQLSTGIDLRQN